ncbi:glycosyltransferase family 1 protein [Patescibacteria group bacterium]|nr:glycosyltransferase family 1 protein [Patescibacteria group bacterium]
MKKILLVTDAWAPQKNGVTVVLNRFIAFLSERGYEVKVIHPELFRTVALPTYPEIHLAIFARRRVASLIREFDPDAIHLMTEGPLGWAARSVCKEKKIPFTSWYHTNLQLYTDVRLHAFLGLANALLRRFHSLGERTLVTTETLKRQLESQGYQNVVIVPLGVDTERFVRNPSPPATPFTKPVFVYYGRLAIEKSPEDFLRLDLPGTKVVIGAEPHAVFKTLKEKYPDVHFLGKYDVNADLQKFIDQLSACDVFVFPSKTETFGLVVLEALSCGIPVAAYNVMGPKDIITDGVDGYLGDDLADAAIKCLSLSRDACRTKALHYSWNHSIEAFIKNLAPIRAHQAAER